MPFGSSAFAFASAAWLDTMPEFNPFKYNSFPVNGARQSYRLTDALQGANMLVGMVILLVATYGRLGGVTEAHAALGAMTDQVPGAVKALGHQGWTAMPKLGNGTSRWS